MQELAQRCPQIAVLELSDTSVGDPGLAAVAAAYGPQLTSLRLNYTRRWGAHGAAALAARCTALQCFSAACSPLTDDGLAALAAGCLHLAAVCVDRCARVSLDGVMRLVNRRPSVHRVQMAGIFRQSPGEQQAFFTAWARQHGLQYQPRSGLLQRAAA